MKRRDDLYPAMHSPSVIPNGIGASATSEDNSRAIQESIFEEEGNYMRRCSILIFEKAALLESLEVAKLEALSATNRLIELQSEFSRHSIAHEYEKRLYRESKINQEVLVKERDALRNLVSHGEDQLMAAQEEAFKQKEKVEGFLRSNAEQQSDHNTKSLTLKDSDDSTKASLKVVEKQDLNGRLRNVQEKVKIIEVEHTLEITELTSKLFSAEKRLEIAQEMQTKSIQINLELEKRLDAELLSNRNLVTDIAAQRNRTNKDNELAAYRSNLLESELNLQKAELVEVKRSLQLLLSEKEVVANDSSIFVKEVMQKSDKAEKALAEMTLKHDKLTSAMKSATFSHNSQSVNEIKEIKKSLLLAQHTATEREKEVFNLKETIRRECEERVHNILLIDFLKEKLSKSSIDTEHAVTVGCIQSNSSQSASQSTTQQSSLSSSPHKKQHFDKKSRIVDLEDSRDRMLSVSSARSVCGESEESELCEDQTITWFRHMHRKPRKSRSRKPSSNN